MKKSIILISVLAALTVGLFIVTKTLKQDDDKSIETYLEEDGFVYDEEGQFYKKVNSEITMNEYFEKVAKDENCSYEELYFYMGSYKILKVKMNYENKYNTSYTVDYNLIDDTVKYTYEASVYSSSILVGGEYKFGEKVEDDSISCNLIADRGMGEEYTDIFCGRAKKETLLFMKEAKELINTPRFSEIIKGAKEDFKNN